jgi:hypothetical protein
MRYFLLVCILLLAAVPCSANSIIPACASDTVANILGTACSIGLLQFTFTGYMADHSQTPADAMGNIIGPSIDLGALNSASLLFSPVGSNGFTLSAPARSVTSSGSYYVQDFVWLLYTVNVLSQPGNQYAITGTHAIGGFSVSGSGIQGLARAGVEFNFKPTPLTSFSSIAEPFDMIVLHGTGPGSISASWNGSTMLTYDLVFVPEPSTLFMLLVGLSAYAAIRLFLLTRSKQLHIR